MIDGLRDINVVAVTQEWDHGGGRFYYYSEAGSTGNATPPIFFPFTTQHMWVPLLSLCSLFWGMASASGVKNLVVFGDSYAGESITHIRVTLCRLTDGL